MESFSTLRLASAPHVAIFETEPAIRALLTLVLEGEGYRVSAFPTDARAFDVIASLHPDCLVLDLPFRGEAACWDLLRTLRHAPATAQLPVILTTTDPQVTQALVADVEIVLKPFDLRDVSARVAAALARARHDETLADDLASDSAKIVKRSAFPS